VLLNYQRQFLGSVTLTNFSFSFAIQGAPPTSSGPEPSKPIREIPVFEEPGIFIAVFTKAPHNTFE
jgi:hypothetical protein